MAAESKMVVIAAFAGNIGLAALKGVAAAATGSSAMLAETLHSIADTGNQGLLFLGMRLGERPPDRLGGQAAGVRHHARAGRPHRPSPHRHRAHAGRTL